MRSPAVTTTAQLLKALREHQVVLRLERDKLICELPRQGLPGWLREALVARKEALKTYIANTLSEQTGAVVIPRRPQELAKVPLSFAQQRLWLLDQIDGSSAHTNMAYALRLQGITDYQAINFAFTTIIQRHESLRTNFVVDNGEPCQILRTAAWFTVAVEDLSTLAEGSRQLTIAEFVNQEAQRRFDLSTDLLIGAQLLKLAEDEHILLITLHHIVSDGWSMAILVREFSELYRAHIQGQQHRLPALEIQYADYAHWQHNWLQHELLDKQLSYWQQQLAGLPVVHSLPLDYPRPKIQSLNGKQHRTHINAATVQAMNALCQTQGATLFMGLQAAFALLLSRYSNEHDIVMGTLIANREQADIAGLIGCFFNALVLRNDLSNSPSFIELLDQSKSLLLDAYAHQQVPFEQIVECLQPERNPSHSPLFQILLIMQNTENSKLQLPNLELEFIEQQKNVAAYDLRLDIIEDGPALSLLWEYRTDLFNANTIERLANHFILLLDSLLKAPQQNVFTVNMLSTVEQHQLLIEWNNSAANYPEAQCIHQRFEAQVEKTPDAIAIVIGEQKISYVELNNKANQLAHYLITEKNIKPDSLVGICLAPSLDMMIAILAVLKAGGAYVPLDSHYPAARLSYMLDDAQLVVVLTHTHLLHCTPINTAHAVCLDNVLIQQQLAQQSTTAINAQHIGLQANHLAYVIYTSGSTGKPKGVEVERKGLRNLLHWYINAYQFTAEDIFLVISSIGFDLTQKNIFAPLLVGGRLIFVDQEYFDPPIILRELAKNAATIINCAPSVFYPLIEASANNNYQSLQTLRYVLFGGEPINNRMLTPWLQQPFFRATIINMYGPTECTDIATQQYFNNTRGTNIGRQIHNVSLYVLNTAHQLAPVNIAGELCIGGAGVARGYLQRAELTAEKFIENPFYQHITGQPTTSDNNRLYKTGDLVRWLPDGTLEFLGRIDHQIKIRGLRIELGEIETALTGINNVKEALVIAKEFATGDARLIAYVVAKKNPDNEYHCEMAVAENRNIFIEQLRHHLNSVLPDYMVPAIFIVLENLPLTPNGKVDRKALPEPSLANQQTTYIAPRTATEKTICSIWQDVFGLERISIADNFFKLGGHSLLAITVKSKINQATNTNIALNTFFADPTVMGVATLIDTLKLNQSVMNELRDDVLAKEGFF